MTDQLFKYGSKKITLTLPDNIKKLEVNPPSSGCSAEEFMSGLESRIKISKESRAGIVVSDKTRLCSYETYLPLLTTFLEQKGVKSDNICFYIAYGTHPRQSDSESLAAYGDTFLKYRFIHHDCNDREAHRSLGITSRGTEVLIRNDVFENDLIILFGAISHHYFAGYGGGRKLLFPGLAFRESVYQNHSLYIDFDRQMLDPGCESGILKGNPVAEDLEEIDKLLPRKLIISGILNTAGKVALIRFDDTYSEFTDSCKVYDESYRYRGDEKFKMVVASAGGYPKDINFIQTHKSLHNAASFVEDGGTLILLAECRDGSGNDAFTKIFGRPVKEIIKELKTSYSGNGGTALATLKKTGRIRVYMHTSLEKSICHSMGISPLTPDEMQEMINKSNTRIAIIENASMIF
ncbi:MAG: nickel-dependent lactate racemase [Marinilabiliaceae bacterium]|nr:nickel-dependent lactate racemase [Marinilabiliaceae bacterium]